MTDQPRSQNTRTSPWQFSLREIIFAFIAMAAVFALISSQRPFQRTSFHVNFDVNKELATACETLGQTLSRGGGGGGGGSGSKYAYQDYQAKINSPGSDSAGQVMHELMTQIEKSLTKSGCTINGRSRGGDPAKKSVNDFDFRYRYRNTRGFISVFSVKTEKNGPWRLIYVHHES